MRLLELMPTLDDKGRQMVRRPGYGLRRFVTKGKTAALYASIMSQTGDEPYDALLVLDDDAQHPEMAKRYDWANQVLYDPDIGVATGNRWFARNTDLPSACRHVWGEMARPIMKALDLPWGGFMLIRWKLIPAFLEVWKRCIFDDCCAREICESHGMEFYSSEHVARIPDWSQIGWGELWHFMVRQYADVRALDQKAWTCLWMLWAVVLFFTITAFPAAPIIWLGIWLFDGGISRNLYTLAALPINQILFLAAIPYTQCISSIQWKGERVRIWKNDKEVR